MTNNTIFTNYEKELLKSMIGKELVKFKHDAFIYSPCVFGMIGIYVNNQVYKLTASLKPIVRFNSEEDVVAYTINQVEESEITSLMDGGQLIETPVFGKIVGIDIVNDYQTIKNDSECKHLESTIGIIFHLEDEQEISFELKTWFSEMITIQKGYNLLEKFTSIDEFYEEWENCNGFVPSCIRKVERL